MFCSGSVSDYMSSTLCVHVFDHQKSRHTHAGVLLLSIICNVKRQNAGVHVILKAYTLELVLLLSCFLICRNTDLRSTFING